MTRNELIERLAELDWSKGATNLPVEFHDLTAGHQQMHRDHVTQNYLPLIVEFVAEWIEAQGQVHHEILPIEGSSLALKWRAEMT